MLKINRKIIPIWVVVLIGTLIAISQVYQDPYLRIYWLALFLCASWSILCIRKQIINMLLVFSIFYALLFALGPMLLYSGGYNFYSHVGNYIIISYLCFAIGFFYSGRGTIKHKSYKIFLPAENSNAVFWISLIVFLIGMIAYSLYFMRSWYSIFTSDLENDRVSAMSGNGIYLWLGSLVWLSVYMLYEQSLINGKYKKTTILLFTISATFSIFLGFRSAIVNPILILFFMRNKKKEIPILRMFAIAIVLFAFVGIYGAIRSGSGSAFKSLLNEFKVSSVNLNNILNWFPKRVDYQYGATYLLDFRTLFDKNVAGTTMWLKETLGLSFSGGGVTPTIIGEFYINWGFVGVVIGMFLSGAFFKRIDRIYRNPNNSIFLSCIILGYIRAIIRGGYANSAVTILVYIVGYCSCQYIAKKIKK